MSSNPTTSKQLLNPKKPDQQQNVSPKKEQKLDVQNSQYSAVTIEAKDLSSIHSYIAETISKDELKTLFSYLRQKVENQSPPNVERKQKMYQLLTREEVLSKYPTVEEITEQQSLQTQEELYEDINILGDSVQEYNLGEIPFNIHNKPRNSSRKKKEILTPDQRVEREKLRQNQLQEQEVLFEDVDLFGETLQEFKPLQPDTVSYRSTETDAPHTIISIPSEMTRPQTSSGPRPISKSLSPEQMAQLEKIRKKRYEEQDQEYSEGNLLGDSAPIGLRSVYSFRQPSLRLKSPRELVFQESIVNVKKNKDQHSRSLPLPVMNFPPSNWPTPIIPEVRKDSDRLREEQRQYFLSLQHAQAQQKSLNQNQNQNEDQKQSIPEAQSLKSTQIQKKFPTQDQNRHQRNLINTNDGQNLFLQKYRHKLLKYAYIILFIQWSIITAMALLIQYHEPSYVWLKETGKWTWLYILCSIILVIIFFIILPFTRQIFPINLMMLTLFTILVAFMFSFVEIYYPNDAVLLALGCACGICGVLALFFRQRRCTFTICCGLSLCSIVIVSIFGIFYLLIDLLILDMVFAAIGVVLYSIYLVFNTKAIVQKTSKFHIESDHYVIGAIHLNLDFIFIIIDMCRCS